ncbi:unnamed protein product [Heterobilharzia americana]|nr:unnamed protein product [Heterobilharzia americana]
MVFTPINENSELSMKKKTVLMKNNNAGEHTDSQPTEQNIPLPAVKSNGLRSSVEFDVLVKPSSSSSSSKSANCSPFTCVHKSRFGLLGALFATYGKTLAWSAFLKLTYDILVFVNPALLKLLLKFLQNIHSEPMWHGYLYAVAIFIDTSVQSVILQCYFHVVFNLGMDIKTGITAAVYRKSLRLSNKARHESTTGQVMNLCHLMLNNSFS